MYLSVSADTGIYSYMKCTSIIHVLIHIGTDIDTGPSETTSRSRRGTCKVLGHSAAARSRRNYLPFIAIQAARVHSAEVAKLVCPSEGTVLGIEIGLVVLATGRPGSPPLLQATYGPFTPVIVGHWRLMTSHHGNLN